MDDKRGSGKLGKDQWKYRIYLVGFPHVAGNSETAPVVDLIESAVPEALILSHDIFSNEFVSRPPNPDFVNESLVDPPEARGHKTRASSIESDYQLTHNGASGEKPQHGSIQADGEIYEEMVSSRPNNFERLPQTTQTEDDDVASQAGSVSSSVTHHFFTPAWIENEALHLLREIQDDAPADPSGDRRRVLLAGYGFGGIIVKQAIVMANTNPRYYDVALNVSNLVFFATPHRSTGRLAWEEVILKMLNDTKKSYRGRLSQILSGLVDCFAQLTHVFYRFASKYPTTNFVDSGDPSESTITKFNNDFEKVVSWKDDGRQKALILCNPYDLDKLEALRTHFAPRHMVSRLHEGITKHLNGVSQKEIDDAYFEALQCLSFSPWILYDTRTFDKPDDFNDLQEIYHPFLRRVSLTDVRGGSVQVTGTAGHGKSSLVKLISQKIRQESSIVVIDNIMSLLGGPPISLYGVYISFIHQIISQRPLLFRPVQNLMVQILRQQAWTIEALKILLASILTHSQNVDYLIVVYDYDTWPKEVQDCWSQIHRLFLKSGNSTCTFVISSIKVHNGLTPGGTHHIDLTKGFNHRKTALIQAKMRYLLETSHHTSSLTEGLSESIKESIISAAQSFNGSLASTSTFLVNLFRSFTLSSRSAIERNILKCPANEDNLYQDHIKALAEKPVLISFWTTMALSWIVFAVRPLHTEELSGAVAISMVGSEISDFDLSVSMDIERDLKTHLGGLVVVENRRVRIVNSLIEKLLIQDYISKSLQKGLETDHRLTFLCLEYITAILKDEMPTTWEKCLSSVSYKHRSQQPRDRTLDFLYYACQFWPTHFLRIKNPDEFIKGEVASFLKQGKIADRWFELYLLSIGKSSNPVEEEIGAEARLPDLGQSTSDTKATRKSALMAGYLGLTAVMPKLTEESELQSTPKTFHVRRGFSEWDVTLPDATSRHYVEYAIASGAEEVIASLLKENRDGIADYLPLHSAALSGSPKTVQLVFERMEDLKRTNSHGRNPLHMAAICGSIEVLRFFVQEAVALDLTKDEDEAKLIDIVDNNSQTPLVLTTRMGHINAARYLAKSGTDLTVRDRTGKTALHYAVLNCPQAVQDFIETDSTAIHIQDNDLCTPLHIAARSGNHEAAATILKAANKSDSLLRAFNAVDSKFMTPLHYAAENGYTEIAKLLVDQGANTEDEEYIMHRVPADLAAEHGHLQTLKAIVGEKTVDQDRLFMTALRAGQLLIVHYLLQHKASPDGRDKDSGDTPLSIAASEGHIEMVRTLLRYGADINKADSERKTPLHHATLSGKLEVVKTLLAHDPGANVNAPDCVRYTPLHHSVKSGYVDITTMLLEHKADVRARTHQGKTPLHLAFRSTEIVQLLLEWGAEPGSLDVMDQTPLHMAALEDNLVAAQLLIQRNVNIDPVDDEGRTPMDNAIGRNHLALVKELFRIDKDESQRDKWHKLHLAVVSSALDVLKFFADKSPDMATMTDDHQRSLLNWAAETSSVDVLTFLLDSGSIILQHGRWGMTPLHDAIVGHKTDNMRELIARGADVNLPDSDGETPLHTAAGNRGFSEAIPILLEAGASINARNLENKTAIFIAAYYSRFTTVNMLIESKADIHLCDAEGWSPLHAAADSLEISKLLVHHGAKVNLAKADLWTPLHLAASWGRADVVRFLLDNDADPNLKNKRGRTALHVALANGHDDVAEVLLDIRGAKAVDLVQPDSLGLRPIHLATMSGGSELVNELISRGVDPKVKTGGKTCLILAIEANTPETLAILLGGDAPSAPGTGWDYGDLVAAYWKALETKQIDDVALLVKKECRLLDEISAQGLTGLEAYLSEISKAGDPDTPLSLLFLDLGADPFRRPPDGLMTAFELGLVSQVELGSNFIDICIERLVQNLERASLGFRELRVVTELKNAKETWKKVQSLMERVPPNEADQDDWNINHFLYQAEPRVRLGTYNAQALSKTKIPSALVWPSNWQTGETSCSISTDGLEVAFEAAFQEDDRGNLCLRSNHPFPPRGHGLSYFELTLLGEVPKDQHNGPSELDDSEERSSSDGPTISIGLSGEFCSLFESHPGWNVWSVGYHGDDGRIWEQDIYPKYKTERTFGLGHTVGCGIDYSAGEYLFTLNGEVIVRKPADLIYRKLYPCVGHSEAAVMIKVNFGAAPFVWKEASRLDRDRS